MRKIDYEYIASNISSLSRIQVRVYKNKELQSNYDPAHFPVDPGKLYIDLLLSIEKPVSYYISPYDDFYGVVKNGDYTLILGPTFQMIPDRQSIREFMFSLDLKANYMEHFLELYSSIAHLPLELFLRELCLIYYFVSEKKVDISEIAIYDTSSDVSRQNKEEIQSVIDDTSKIKADISANSEFTDADYKEHTTVDFESMMLECIKSGDLDGLNTLIKSVSSGRAGKVAPTYLRQMKNIFISTATLVSRAAMAGGLPAEEALSLSDKYIQHAENYNNPDQIMNLQYNMIMDYTNLVNEISNGKKFDKFLRTVTKYIRDHLTEDFSIEEMAEDLSMSRSHLSTKFKEETRITISEYIQRQKISKAKELLKNTERSILEISTYLNFSSQGYFQNVFKKVTGMTPKQYRDEKSRL